MKKRKRYQPKEKPRMCDPGMCDPGMCDPGMCDNCIYIGDGDFICDRGPGEPVLVVEDWEPNENYLMCRRNRRTT